MSCPLLRYNYWCTFETHERMHSQPGSPQLQGVCVQPVAPSTFFSKNEISVGVVVVVGRGLCFARLLCKVSQ